VELVVTGPLWGAGHAHGWQASKQANLVETTQVCWRVGLVCTGTCMPPFLQDWKFAEKQLRVSEAERWPAGVHG